MSESVSDDSDMAMWSPRLPGAVTVYTGVMCAVVYNISTYFTAVEPYMVSDE